MFSVLNPDANRGQGLFLLDVNTYPGAGTTVVAPVLGAPYMIYKLWLQYPSTTVTGADVTITIQANNGTTQDVFLSAYDVDANDNTVVPQLMTLTDPTDVAVDEWLEAITVGGTLAETIRVLALCAWLPATA